MRIRGASLGVLAGVLLACGGGGGGGASKSGEGPTGWTILVYVAADNDLEPFALFNLEQMAAVGSSAGLNIVAQVDRAELGRYTPSPFHGDSVLNLSAWSTTKRLLVRHEALEEVADLGEIDTADPASLADFIQWGVTTYPAAHYMVVLWDHGGGWTGFGVDQTVPGRVGQTFMALDEIRTGVRDGLARAGSGRVDVIGFDACLMATFEVGESLEPFATYLLASQELEPGHGWDYTALAGAAEKDALALSKAIADGYQALANSPPWNTGASITMSVVDLTKLGPVESAIAAVGAHYGSIPDVSPLVSPIAKGRAAALGFGRSPNPADDSHLVDLGDLFANLSALGEDAVAVQSAVEGAVAYRVNGSSFARATGLSIYFPPEAALYDAASYDELPGTESWRSFLSAYYGAAATAAVPAFAGGTFSATHDLLTLDGTLTAGSLASVTSASLHFGLPGSGSDAWLFGDRPAEASSSSGVDHVVGTWDYSFLHLTQETPSPHDEYGYLSVQQLDAENGIALVPFSYYRSGATTADPVFRAIVFTLSTGEILSDVYYLSTDGALGELLPERDSTLRARLLHLPAAAEVSGTWEDFTTTGGFDARSPIDLEFVQLDAGDPFFAGLRVVNPGGEGDWIAMPVPGSPTRP